MSDRTWLTWGALSCLTITLACADDRATPHTSAALPTRAEAGSQAPQTGWDAIAPELRPARVLPELKAAALVPDRANHGTALFTEIMSVPPGGDVMFCSYTSFIVPDRLYLHDTRGVQSRFGHHVIMQYTTSPQPVGTHECAANSLEAQQSQIIGGAGEGAEVAYSANVVSEIPAGAQLIINHHWINTSDAPVEVQAEMVTVPPPADRSDLVVARAFIVQTTAFQVAPHVSSQASVHCELDRDVRLISVLGHEHEWGTHVRAERMGSQPDVLFDHPYEPSMALHPMVRYFPLEAPYRIKAGDAVRLACNWNNTTDAPLRFPGEMCVLAAWQLGAAHDTMCFDGVWVQ